MPSTPDEDIAEELERIRREWLNAPAPRYYSDTLPTTEAQGQGTIPAQGTPLEHIEGEEPDDLPTPRLRRPRDSYNRGLCIIRQRRAQAPCNRSCPCRATYPVAEAQPRSEPETRIFSEHFGTLRWDPSFAVWVDGAQQRYSAEYINYLMASEREGGHDEEGQSTEARPHGDLDWAVEVARQELRETLLHAPRVRPSQRSVNVHRGYPLDS